MLGITLVHDTGHDSMNKIIKVPVLIKLTYQNADYSPKLGNHSGHFKPRILRYSHESVG